MTDLDMVTAMRPDVPLPSSRELGESRRRLDETIGAELSAVATRPWVTRRPRQALVPLGRTRPFTRVALAGVLVAAVVGAALFITVPSPNQRDKPPVVQLAAAQYLHKVAEAALARPARRRCRTSLCTARTKPRTEQSPRRGCRLMARVLD